MKYIANWIDGRLTDAVMSGWIDKFNPHSGELLCKVADSSAADVERAIAAASKSYNSWAWLSPVKRGMILSDIVSAMKERKEEIASCIALENGKPHKDAAGETWGAILLGEFFAGEGMRLYGRSFTSGMEGKQTFSVRQPRGIAGLIVPANTPIANIAWKVFPALVCGNTVVLKAAEDSPEIACLFAGITKAAGLPDGVLNVIQGKGDTAGALIVEHPEINVVSFTGSTRVGKMIAETTGRRLARVSLELGGKNPFVVCDDADLDKAVHWAVLSAFSNAGQRCAAGSRLLIFEGIYKAFSDKFVAKTKQLKLGTYAEADLGPVINQKQQANILKAIEKARLDGANILCGGGVPSEPELNKGYYIQPTILENLSQEAAINCDEIFGPVVTLQPVKDIAEALELANATEFGLTAAIHTKDTDRAMWFAQKVKAGVCNINLGTFGSEPHMPFGGFGSSGNGTREPGTEALDVYSELKCISTMFREDLIFKK